MAIWSVTFLDRSWNLWGPLCQTKPCIRASGHVFWLVVSTPPKNMKVSWDDDIPNIWKNKSHVPNYQPVLKLLSIWKTSQHMMPHTWLKWPTRVYPVGQEWLLGCAPQQVYMCFIHAWCMTFQSTGFIPISQCNSPVVAGDLRRCRVFPCLSPSLSSVALRHPCLMLKPRTLTKKSTLYFWI